MPFDLRGRPIPGRRQGTASAERTRTASTRDDRFLLAVTRCLRPIWTGGDVEWRLRSNRVRCTIRKQNDIAQTGRLASRIPALDDGWHAVPAIDRHGCPSSSAARISRRIRGSR